MDLPWVQLYVHVHLILCIFYSQWAEHLSFDICTSTLLYATLLYFLGILNCVVHHDVLLIQERKLKRPSQPRMKEK